LWFTRAGSRLSSGFLLPGISLGCTRTHVCVCELVLVQARTACLQRRTRATRRPARRWYRHGAAGWAALGAGDGLALTTCLQSALWRTWRQEERQVDGSRIESDGSFELHHMELTVDYGEGDDAPKDDHVQGVEGNSLRFMFNPKTEAVQSCRDEACFTCFSSTRMKASKVPLQLLHRRLGHFDSRVIGRMVNHRAIDVTLVDRKCASAQSERL